MRLPRDIARGIGCTLPCAGILLAAAMIALLATAPTAQAAPVVQPYISVSATPASLDLGTVPQPGTYDSPAELKVHVTANCIHGGVMVAVTPLVRAEGGSIGPAQVFLRLPSTGTYISMSSAVAVTGPAGPGIFDFVLKFRVVTTLADAAGEYAGTLTITCSAAP